MKKILFSMSFAAIVASASANPVSLQTAQIAAQNFLSGKDAGRNLTLQLVHSYLSTAASGQTTMYVFDVNQGNGFIIVSGDDAVTPVLAYSTENIFPAQITNNEVAYWMNGYNEQISYVITNQLSATPEVAAAWNYLLNNHAQEGNTAAKPTGISPMLTTTWDQMNPYWSGSLLYNNLCPPGTPTGCVATAMAQIMNYWQYPESGTGSHTYNTSSEGGVLSADFNTTYDWDNMPSQLSGSSTTAQKNAVALLMYHCGVSVEMDYDLAENGGSGAYVINYYGYYEDMPCSQNALVDYFGYDEEIEGLMRGYYSNSEWISMLKTELDEGRPILYTGYGELGGHAFVFDGYNDENNGVFFHVNWGWSGNSNGYFVVNNLAPEALGVGGGGGNFNSGQEALINIHPAAIRPKLAINAALSASQTDIEPAAAFTINADLKNTGTGDLTNGLLTCGVYNASGATLIGYMDILSDQNLISGNNMSVTFSTPGMEEMTPGSYKVKVLYKADASDANWKLVSDGNMPNALTIHVNATSITNQNGEASQIFIFPNPASDNIVLDWGKFNGKITDVQLVNMLGQQVYQNDIFSGTTMKIALDGLSSGNYFMRIITDKGAFTKKITIQ